MKNRWLGALIVLSLMLTSVSWGTPFSLSKNSLQLVVAPGFNHTSVLVDLSSTSPGIDYSATTVTSDSNWVTPTIDAANQELVLNFSNAALTNSSYTATITLNNGADAQTLTVNLSLSPLTLFRLLSDPSRSRVYGVHQSGTLTGSLIIYNPTTQAAVGCVTVGKKPSAMCISNDGSELYVLNSADPSISVIDLSTLRQKESIYLSAYSNWGASSTFGNIATGPGSVLYYSDGSWAPVLRVFDRNTKQVLQTITGDASGNGVGGFALSQDKSVLLSWAQYGWSAGWAGSYICKYTVNGSGLLTFSQSTPSSYPTALSRDPLGTPVLGSYDNTRFFIKQWAVDPANVNSVLQTFPSPIYSITPNGEVAVTSSAVIQKDTGTKLYTLPFTTTVQAITTDYAKLVLFNPTSHSLSAIDLIGTVGQTVLGLNLTPADGSISLAPATLEWSPISGVNNYQVYLSSTASDLTNATPSSSCYLGQSNLPSINVTQTLTPGTTYYWRVDSVLGQSTTAGQVYSFTVATISPSVSKITAATVSGHTNYQVSVGLTTTGSSANWQASADQTWVSFLQTSGTTPGNLNVVLNAGSLAAGIYTANITLQSGSATSFVLPVTLKVEPLKVTVLQTHPQDKRVYAISEDTGTAGATAYLLELDSDAGSILRVVPVGNSATDLAVHVPDGRIYVTNWMPGRMVAVDMTSFQQVQTYSVPPFAGTGYSQSDVYDIAPGVTGRLLSEGYDQWIRLAIYNTVSGTSMATSFQRQGGGAFESTGRYYYHGDDNISDPWLHKFDVSGDVFTETKKAQIQSVSYYGSRTVVVSGSGNGVFWNGGYFDSNLNLLWTMGVEVFSCTPDAHYAFGQSSIYDTVTKQAVLNMPVSTKVSAYNATTNKLVVQAGTQMGYYAIDPKNLPAPVLSSGSVSRTSVGLSWVNSSLCTGFTLQKRLTGGSSWDNVALLSSTTTNQIVTGLVAGTSYDFRIEANGSLASSPWSNIVTITTAPAPWWPSIAYAGNPSVTYHEADLTAWVNPAGVATTAFFQYGTDTGYTSGTTSGQLVGSGTSNVAVSGSLTGLSANTTYHYRVVLTSGSGTYSGLDQTFTTPSPITNGGATGIVFNGATLNGSVNPTGVATTVYFQYGTDMTYSSGTTASQSLGSGTSAVSVSASLSGLQPNTPYHYRMVVTNEFGTTYGDDQIFSTPEEGAQKVIYNYMGRMSNTGAGAEYSMTTRGCLIWDPSTNTIDGVFAFEYRGQKGVSILRMSDQQVYVLRGAAGKEYTLISVSQSNGSDNSYPTFETDLIQGRRYPMTIGGTSFTVPKSMTDSEIFTDYSDSGEPVLLQMKGSYSLDAKASAASNTAKESVDQAAVRIKANYLQKGYTDIDQ